MYLVWPQSRYAYARQWFPAWQSQMASFCVWISMLHCNFLLSLSCISISSTNVGCAVAGAHWCNCGLMTAITVNMAVLYLKYYSWCKTTNRSHSTSWCSSEHVSACSDYKGTQWIEQRQWCTKVNILHKTVGCVNATINRKARKLEPEMGTNVSGQTRQNSRVDGKGSGFVPPRRSGSSFWMVLEPNRTFFPVQTRAAGGSPGPVANTWYTVCRWVAI